MLNVKNSILDRYGFHSEKELKLTDFLFKDCNNKCDFCFENDNEFKSVCSNIPQYKDITDEYVCQHLDFIRETIQKYGYFNKIKFTIMGGELFFNDDITLIDKYFSGLLDIFDPIRDKLSVQIVSNLIHGNVDYITDLIIRFRDRKIKYILNTSFDFGCVRFSNVESYNLFKRNIKKIVENKNRFGLNIGCGIILTRHMLDSLKKSDDQCKTFDFICENMSVDFARLSGNFQYKLSYDEIVELLNIIVDRYEDLVENVLYKEHSEPRCCLNNKHILITGNSCVEACVSYVYNMMNNSCESCKHNEVVSKTIKYGCLNCKYFGHCIPQCPLDDHYEKCEMKPVIERYLSKV